MELDNMIQNYLRGVFGGGIWYVYIQLQCYGKELDAAKEYAERVIESRIDENPTLANFQKDEYKRQFKC